jgi:hypothetical protein
MDPKIDANDMKQIELKYNGKVPEEDKTVS